MPFPRGKKPSVTKLYHGKITLHGLENQEDGHHVKRSPSSPQGGPKKRSAFIDLTNAKTQIVNQTKNEKPVKKPQKSKATAKNDAKLKESKAVSSEGPLQKVEEVTVEESPVEELVICPPEELVICPPEELVICPPQELVVCPPEVPTSCRARQVPEEFDIDKEHAGDCFLSPEYAKDIFDYLRDREEKFVLKDYMQNQPDLNEDMRGILVDWMVEVQENFELNHETLYLAVKLTDHYLASTVVVRQSLQLIGSTAMLIAAKFEERCPPCIDDFLYICDDAYKRQELIAMEMNVLRGLQFDINIPVPYRFLRRYAKCARASMETLTLARYVCELSLLELELVPERASLLASACLLLALITKGLEGWTSMLEYHSGYTVMDLSPLVRRLHSMLTCPSDDKLKAVNSKYSHKVFFEVAKIPPVDIPTLEEALKVPEISQ